MMTSNLLISVAALPDGRVEVRTNPPLRYTAEAMGRFRDLVASTQGAGVEVAVEELLIELLAKGQVRPLLSPFDNLPLDDWMEFPHRQYRLLTTGEKRDRAFALGQHTASYPWPISLDEPGSEE